MDKIFIICGSSISNFAAKLLIVNAGPGLYKMKMLEQLVDRGKYKFSGDKLSTLTFTPYFVQGNCRMTYAVIPDNTEVQNPFTHETQRIHGL